MTEGIGKLLRDIIIAIGVFVPLMNHMHHLLQTYTNGVNVFYLPHSEQLTLLALTLVPLVVLRLVYGPSCRVQQSVAAAVKSNKDHPRH